MSDNVALSVHDGQSPADPRSEDQAHIDAPSQRIVARAWAGLILVLFARAYRAFLLTLVCAAIVPSLFSLDTYLVESGSMEPSISRGDVVIGQRLGTDEQIPVGRVMFFTTPADDEKMLLHRVVERLDDGTYTTAGDANADVDTTPVPASNFHARGLVCVPFAGLPLIWLSTGDLFPFTAWLLITVAALILAARRTNREEVQPTIDERDTDRTDRTDEHDRDAPRSPLLARLIAGRATTTIALATVIGLGAALTVGFSVDRADAAFTAQTANAGSTWTVAVKTSRAVSTMRVWDMPSASGWYQRGSVGVNIAATSTDGAVRSITYRVNGQAPVTINSSSLTFTLSTQGDNTITYYATDRFGVAEAAHTDHVKLDNQAPVLAVTSRTGDMTHKEWASACSLAGAGEAVCGTVTDGSGSGVVAVGYVLFRSSDARCFDGEKWTGAACTKRPLATLDQGLWIARVPSSALELARTWYTITVYASDAAGNTTNTTRTFSIG
ncbi:hypothetical protein GCM10027416_02710 [Okibacterium endophyticum]